ncbi:hypothetical protein JCGZ_24374 [Jatropha curcas]|uniref:Transcriptional corepressor SEUSS n=1 Tax=Jatropha curcas TaxID=180498 RepID=A0A067LDN0_JATCU|nr:transcriptional corepressor SEUSS [Jatropha curcas]XP_012066573.1 transcriptional corepressor SEUSS [Jatropha curcas]KDP42600.1 hypothetical protein JCGZ_24374 [Jatropha curcas]
MTLLGNSPNVSSLLNQTFGNGGSSTSLSGSSGFQLGSVDTTVESNPVSFVTNDVGFSSSLATTNLMNSVSSSQIPNHSGSSSLSDQQLSQIQQFESQRFQHGQQTLQPYPVSQNQPQQTQLRSIRGALGGGLGPVKLEPQVINDQIGPQPRLKSLQSPGPVKLEPQQNQIGRGIGPIKQENQHSDQALFLQQQQHQQQHQLLHMSRQSSQAAIAQMNLLQQQHILQMQQQQQQQLLRVLPQQQSQLHHQSQQQNVPVRSAMRPVYEPGTCARRLIQYMYRQQHRPPDNNIEFWRKFVFEFFAQNARKRWCVSLYGNSRQTNGVFNQDLWHCEICNHKPGRGFETTVEVLPRLFKIKYDSGTLEELLYVDMPHEYQNSRGQIVLDYAKAIQESVFEHLRVVRDGQLRIVFSSDLKICSWEFCARRHEELIPRRLIIPQVSQLGAAAQKYQASAQNASSSSSQPDLESNCNMFLSSARQLAKALEVPLVNDLGYTKRYVRCLQISEVVNSMKDLIDYSQETRKGPMESLAQFPRRTRSSLSLHYSVQQPVEQQQTRGHSFNNDHHTVQTNVMHPSTSSGVASADNSCGTVSTTSSVTTVAGLRCQNSMNSWIETQMNNPGSPYAGTPVQIPSAGSSTTLPPAQPNPSSPFSSPTPSSSNNLPQSSQNVVTASTASNHLGSANSPAQIPLQQSSQSNEVDPNESQSSVEKIIQEIVTSSQFSGGGSMVSVDSEGNNMKNINGFAQKNQNILPGDNCLLGNCMVDSSSSTVGVGFRSLSCGNGLSAAASGVKAVMGNNYGILPGRVGMPLRHQDAGIDHQQEFTNRLLSGLGAVNGYFDHQFDWKSP